MKIIKFILKLFGGLVALSIVAGIAVVYWDNIEFQYTKLFWEPNPTTVHGVSIGDPRSDVIFKKGQPYQTIGDMFAYEGQIGAPRTEFAVQFDENDVVNVLIDYEGSQESAFDLPFTTVEAMKEILGEEDILAISKNFETRRYTYLQWGASYLFNQNDLTSYMIGNVQWGGLPGGGEYIVKGRAVCPSDDCPWDDEVVLKPEYEDKDYTMFLPD